MSQPLQLKMPPTDPAGFFSKPPAATEQGRRPRQQRRRGSQTEEPGRNDWLLPETLRMDGASLDARLPKAAAQREPRHRHYEQKKRWR